MTIRIIKRLFSIRKRIILILTVFYMFFSCLLSAIPVDTIYTNVAETMIVIGKEEIIVTKEKQSSISYQSDTEYLKWCEIKASLDSCIWQNYYEGKIGQGYSRFLLFIFFNRNGDIDDIYFSQPLSASDDNFYCQVISVIKEEIKGNHHYKNRMEINRCFYSLYKINLYP